MVSCIDSEGFGIVERLPFYIYVVGEANIKALEELYMRNKEKGILTPKLDEYFTQLYADKWEARGEARGEIRGEARGKAQTILAILRKRFNRVPKDTKRTILSMNDPVALESWAVQAAICESLAEFATALK
jgi:hypothetical protein